MSSPQATRPHIHVVPGLGTFEYRNVGTGGATTGCDHRFCPEGSNSELPGYVRFCAKVTPEFQIAWDMEPAGEQFTQDILDVMRERMESLHLREPNAWWHHADGALLIARNDYYWQKYRYEDSIGRLENLLADPMTPRNIFVSPEKSGTPKGLHRPATPEEREERREIWAQKLATDQKALNKFKEERDPRMKVLEDMSSALAEWAHPYKKAKPCPYETIKAAIPASTDLAPLV